MRALMLSLRKTGFLIFFSHVFRRARNVKSFVPLKGSSLQKRFRSLAFLSVFSFFLFPATSFSICVKTKSASLRLGPGTQFRKVWTVGKYMPFLQVKRKGAWVQVEDLEGVQYWVHSNSLTESVSCVVVKQKRASLYLKSSTRHAKVAYQQADRYTAFKRLKIKGSWYYVQDAHGQKAWIQRSKVWRPLKVSNLNFE